MKKNIFVLFILILFTTGCTCSYNLTIENDDFKESITITGENSDEIKNINQKWQIPTDKNNYYLGDEDIDYSSLNDIYKYTFNNNKLTLYNDFKKSTFVNSTAVSICYKTFNMTNYEKNTIISTNNIADCFDAYPNLTNILVNITMDKKVTSNNADSVNGNTYTWKINRNNYKNKSINIIYQNGNKEDETTISNNENASNTKKTDYGMFIFAGIMLIIVLIIYGIFNFIKNKNDEMDD